MGRLKGNLPQLLIGEEGDELTSSACLQTMTGVWLALLVVDGDGVVVTETGEE